MDEADSKVAMISKFKEIFIKIADEELSAVLYPYLTSSSDVPCSALSRIPKTYTELKRYVPSLNPPVKNGNIAYCQIYLGINTTFVD